MGPSYISIFKIYQIILFGKKNRQSTYHGCSVLHVYETLKITNFCKNKEIY